MHFFTEPTIPSQDSISAIPYGPLSGFEETDFVTGSQFTFASLTKAFACQEGMMFIQQSLFSDCVNVILKPINPTDIEFTPVKYYVYRGLLKDSFLNGTAIRAKTTNESEFINDFWDNWEQYKTNTGQSGLPDPSPQSIGYDVSLSGTIKVEDIFNNSSADVRSVYVKEGDWIGNFGNTYTSVFEIITDSDHLDINLDFLRETSFPISVSSTTPTTPAEKFAQKVEREKILSFVDAAAFFGMHYDAGVKISTYSSPGNKQTETRKKDALYNDLISKFATKNRVYVDIRNERGYFYNFYDNYGDTNDYLLKVKAESAPDFTNDHYYTSKWPIFFDENPIYPTGRVNKLQIKLRIDDNIKPLLFLRNSTLRGKLRKSHFINEKKLLDGTAVDWSKAIQLKLPNTGSSPSKVNVAWHVQLQYLKQDESESDPNYVPINHDSLDSLIPNISLPYQGGALTVFQHLQASKYTLVSGEDFAYVARSGVYRDVDDVVFYTQPEYTYTESSNAYSMASDLRKTQNTPLTSSPVFPKNIKLSRVTVNEGIDDVFVITIANVNRFNKTTKKESLFLLGLTNNELDTLSDVADNLGLVKGHAVNLLFSNETLIDEAGKIPYRKYELNVQGLTADGFVSSTVSTGVFVYTLDGQNFNSKAFGNQSNISLGLPDPGTLTPWKYVGKWEYDANILASESMQGIVTIDDKGTNNYIPPLSIELRGAAFFPLLTPSGTINDIPSPRPVIFIVHGNGQGYQDYYKNNRRDDDIALCEHLAKNGFITVSISCLFYEYFEMDDTLLVNPAYAPFTHYLRMDGKLYFYNNTSTDPDYQKLYFLNGNDTTPSAVHANTKETMKYGVDFIIDIRTPPEKDRITFIKDFSKYRHGMAALGRSNVLYEHMKIIKTKFDTKISNNVGILGHSRGGEAVIFAANEILDTTSSIHSDLYAIGMNNLQSVISLAPTHQYGRLEQKLQQNASYFVLYGSRDYDVSGAYFSNPNLLPSLSNNMPSGISLYDKSFDQEKSLIFVTGATHNGFITSNKPDLDSAQRNNWLYDDEEIMDKSVQHNISKAFFNAHFRKNLYNEDFWLPLFTGDVTPDSVETNKPLLSQYETVSSQNELIIYPSSIYRSGSVAVTTSYNGSGGFQNDFLRVNDGFDKDELVKNGTSPHYTQGITLKWEAGKELIFELGSTEDASAYDYLSFRIANLDVGNDLKGVKIGLKSLGVVHYIGIDSVEKADKRSDKTDIIQKDISGVIHNYYYNSDPTKHVMKTIRISLSEYGDLGISLSSVEAIFILFSSTGSGKISFNNLLFTK